LSKVDKNRSQTSSWPVQGGRQVAHPLAFASRKTGARIERAVLGIVKRAAAKAGIEAPVSPHWLKKS